MKTVGAAGIDGVQKGLDRIWITASNTAKEEMMRNSLPQLKTRFQYRRAGSCLPFSSHRKIRQAGAGGSLPYFWLIESAGTR